MVEALVKVKRGRTNKGRLICRLLRQISGISRFDYKCIFLQPDAV